MVGGWRLEVVSFWGWVISISSSIKQSNFVGVFRLEGVTETVLSVGSCLTFFFAKKQRSWKVYWLELLPILRVSFFPKQKSTDLALLKHGSETLEGSFSTPDIGSFTQEAFIYHYQFFMEVASRSRWHHVLAPTARLENLIWQCSPVGEVGSLTRQNKRKTGGFCSVDGG